MVVFGVYSATTTAPKAAPDAEDVEVVAQPVVHHAIPIVQTRAQVAVVIPVLIVLE